MDLGSEQPEKQISKKLKARGKGDECRGVFMGQYLDSLIGCVQVVSLLAFRFQRGLELLSALQKFTRVLWGTDASAGCPKKEGSNLPSSDALSYVYMSVPINYL